jgi:hypothetical protein
MTDEEFVAAFEACTLADFPHCAHVRLAWVYLRREPLVDAAARFVGGLRRFAASLGASGKYHETITWAYLLWIHECLRAAPADHDFAAFAQANPSLFERDGLLRFYRAETLASAEARRVFVLPDHAAQVRASMVPTV